ncbi:MAG: hypothetical protein K0Q43_86 [Ramlibacter sp.]|jgi:hypothetical protein|nr:hypothetical protein [Ramlibacter sp.]
MDSFLSQRVRTELVDAIVEHFQDKVDRVEFVSEVARDGFRGWNQASDVELLEKVAEDFDGDLERIWDWLGEDQKERNLLSLAANLRPPGPAHDAVLRIATSEYAPEPDSFWDQLNAWCVLHRMPPVFTETEFESAHSAQHDSDVAAPRP